MKNDSAPSFVQASACAATPFHATHSCADHYAMLSNSPAGGQQGCVVTHLNMVDGADSAHCGHARGEGPCAAAAGTYQTSLAFPA